MPSRKRSATRPAPGPPEPIVFFVDRSLGKRLGEALREQGETVVQLHEAFDRDDTADEDWLPHAGKKGWVVLTADKKIRRRPLERAALFDYEVMLFALTSGSLSGREQADVIVRALPRIKRLVGQYRGPFIGRVTQAADVRIIEPAKPKKRRTG